MACVVRSFARRSLSGGALADTLTFEPGAESYLYAPAHRLAVHDASTRLRLHNLVFADARLVYALSDQWKLHTIPGPPQLAYS